MNPDFGGRSSQGQPSFDSGSSLNAQHNIDDRRINDEKSSEEARS